MVSRKKTLISRAVLSAAILAWAGASHSKMLEGTVPSGILESDASHAGPDACGGGVRTRTIYTLPTPRGVMVLPCRPPGPARMTYSTAVSYIEAVGLAGELGPILARASDLDNPSINRDRARAGRAGTMMDLCLRKNALLPDIPDEPTPWERYLERIRLAGLARRDEIRQAVLGCLGDSGFLVKGRDWTDSVPIPAPPLSGGERLSGLARGLEIRLSRLEERLGARGGISW